MTLDDLQCQNRDFILIFRAISGCDTKLFTRRCHRGLGSIIMCTSPRLR